MRLQKKSKYQIEEKKTIILKECIYVFCYAFESKSNESMDHLEGRIDLVDEDWNVGLIKVTERVLSVVGNELCLVF